jgi:hypothetical protein
VERLDKRHSATWARGILLMSAQGEQRQAMAHASLVAQPPTDPLEPPPSSPKQPVDVQAAARREEALRREQERVAAEHLRRIQEQLAREREIDRQHADALQRQEMEAQRKALDELRAKQEEQRRQIEEARLKLADEQERREREEQERREHEERARLKLLLEQTQREVQKPAALAYNGLSSGEIVWEGILKGTELITIENGQASSGTVTGSLPGVPCLIQPTDPKKVSVASAPGPRNQYNRLVIRVSANGRTRVTLKWSLP